MSKIAINLLPIEFREQDLKNAKFYQVQTVGVTIILLMIVLASLIVGLRVLQSQNISQIQTTVAASEQKLSDLKNTESSLFLLKNRLTAINQYLGIPSKQVQTYHLITKLLPPSVLISSISVSKSAEVLALVIVPDVDSLDSLLNNLTYQQTNEDKISQVSLESINRSRDGVYRLSLKIKPR